METILVTGGAGFIGSNFIRYMLDKYPKYQIINIDILSYAGDLNNLEGLEEHKNYKFVRGNICNRKLIEKIIKTGVDMIVNFAAESHVDRSINDPSVFVKTNVQGTQVLLDAAVKYGIKKYVQISTDEVYGTLGQKGFFTEKSSLAPNNPYAASKAGADLMVRAYHKTYNLPIVITRCTNNYGPYQYTEKLIPLMITNALQEIELPVYGDGLQIRDWIYVEDHCKAIDLVLHKGKNGEVYNIGANNERQNIEIVNIILDKLDKSKRLIVHVNDRPGHDRRYAINARKIQEELGWAPEYSFEKGLKKTIDWYVNNKQWWEEKI